MKQALFLGTLLSVMLVSAAGQDLVVNVNLATLNAYVEDESGHPVRDLRAEDFEIIEKEQLRPVKHFARFEEPIALGLVVDRSSSIAPVKEEIDRAVRSILGTLRAGDEAFLVTFAGASKLNVAWTSRPQELRDSLERTKLSYGSRFYDAVLQSLRQLSTSRTPRKALIIFSDGADHYSQVTFEELLNAAQPYRAPIYLIGFVGEDSRTWSDEGRRTIRNRFAQLGSMTGGKSLFPVSNVESARFAKDIVDSLSVSYVLGFYTSEPLTGLSDVRVRVRAERVPKATVWISQDSTSEL